MAGIKRDQADKWFSDCIRHAAGYECEHCKKQFSGLVQGFECCHIYGRASKSTRWCRENAVALCGGCHRRFTEHPLEFQSWLAEYLGQGCLDVLREKFNTPIKTNKEVRKAVSAHYRAEFRRMQEHGSTDLVSWN